LNISDILFLTSASRFFATLLEIPTSAIGDIFSRSRVLLLSVFSVFIARVIYLIYPDKIAFFVAVFFMAL